jgi:hypothetical protein
VAAAAESAEGADALALARSWRCSSRLPAAGGRWNGVRERVGKGDERERGRERGDEARGTADAKSILTVFDKFFGSEVL